LNGEQLNKKSKFHVLIILIIFSSSCKKKYVVEISPEYEGEWHSIPVVSPTTGVGYEAYFIIIDGQGEAGGCNSTLVDTNCFQHFNGDALFNWNKSRFCIGKTFEGTGSIIFHINKPYI